MTQQITKHTVTATVEAFTYKALDPKTMTEKDLYYLKIQKDKEEPLSLNVGKKTYEHIVNLTKTK